MTDVHSGGCVCGAVRYRVHGSPTVSTVCHCTFCQRRLASAFAVLASFPEQSVEMLQGELTECEHRSDESGRWLRMSFCAKCGTTVTHTAELRPGIRTIAAGTFDDPRLDHDQQAHLGPVQAPVGHHPGGGRDVSTGLCRSALK